MAPLGGYKRVLLQILYFPLQFLRGFKKLLACFVHSVSALLLPLQGGLFLFYFPSRLNALSIYILQLSGAGRYFLFQPGL